jgi:hypothetical protein
MRTVIAELDDISTILEKSGNKVLATRLDTVTNTIDQETRSRTAGKRVKADENNPGWEDSDEDGRSDAFEAKNYHREPVGSRAVTKLVAPSVKEIFGRLDLATEDTVNLQASRKRIPQRAAQRRQAAETAYCADEGDDKDTFSTNGMPESGDESRCPPIDKDQTGEPIEMVGTVPYGSLTASARRARQTLRAAANVSVESSEEITPRTASEAVEGESEVKSFIKKNERDLVTSSAKRTATVHYPVHVPMELRGMWDEAARTQARRGKLMTAGKVNYDGINKVYAAALAKCREMATRA